MPLQAFSETGMSKMMTSDRNDCPDHDKRANGGGLERVRDRRCRAAPFAFHDGTARHTRVLSSVLILASLSACSGFSFKQYATNAVADALAESSGTYASDADIEFVGAAIPFGLKTIESLLAQAPDHRGLLLAATRGFTQYAYVYVEQPANEIEENDVDAAYAQRERARGLYLRARDYGLRGLETTHTGFPEDLRIQPDRTVVKATREDVPLLYWTSAAWAAGIALSKDDPDAVAELPLVERLIYRALELDESFDDGAIHTFLIAYEMSRRSLVPDAADRARSHFDRAVALSDGSSAAPYVSLAEAVAVPQNRRGEFGELLEHALGIEIEKYPERLLANAVMQRRAQWLLAHSDDYFVD